MTVTDILLLIPGLASTLFLAVFFLTSVREKRLRASILSLALTILSSALWLWIYFIAGTSLLAAIIILSVFIVSLILFFAPISSAEVMKANGESPRVDERDTMFARMKHSAGAEAYEDYYKSNPDLKATDDKIRKLPRLLAPGGKYYDKARSSLVRAMFDFEEKQINDVDGNVSCSAMAGGAESFTEMIKQQALFLGAAEVGIARLNQNYVYSHVGIGPEPRGSEIINKHSFAIAFTVEMDYAKVQEAPQIGTCEETARQYLNAQRISISLAGQIRRMGYPARAHISGSNYEVMLPPVAHDAGLGELGRCGYIISGKYGARVRLGCITTDLPLVPDKPKAFGVQDFCRICSKCAVNCPSGSIPTGGKENIRGVDKWQLNIESCYKYWRIIGTDCAICMKACPFSHPDTFVHNVVRAGIKRSAFARRAMLWGDELFYGRSVR